MKSGESPMLWGVRVPLRKKGLEPSCICIRVMGVNVTQHPPHEEEGRLHQETVHRWPPIERATHLDGSLGM